MAAGTIAKQEGKKMMVPEFMRSLQDLQDHGSNGKFF